MTTSPTSETFAVRMDQLQQIFAYGHAAGASLAAASTGLHIERAAALGMEMTERAMTTPDSINNAQKIIRRVIGAPRG